MEVLIQRWVNCQCVYSGRANIEDPLFQISCISSPATYGPDPVPYVGPIWMDGSSVDDMSMASQGPTHFSCSDGTNSGDDMAYVDATTTTTNHYTSHDSSGYTGGSDETRLEVSRTFMWYAC